jgi:hypothetical protein
MNFVSALLIYGDKFDFDSGSQRNFELSPSESDRCRSSLHDVAKEASAFSVVDFMPGAIAVGLSMQDITDPKCKSLHLSDWPGCIDPAVGARRFSEPTA